MTAAQRATLKQHIDQAARERIAADKVDWTRCSGCGCASENRSIGCKTCSDRHRRRTKPRPNVPRRRCIYCGARHRRTRSKVCSKHGDLPHLEVWVA